MFRHGVAVAVLALLAGPVEALAQKPAPGNPQQERVRQMYRRASPRTSERPVNLSAVTVPESEPNDAAGTADALSLGDQATGEVNPMGDADYWIFTVTAGTIIDIDVDASQFGSPLDPTLELYDTDGVTSLAFNDDAAGLDSRIFFSIGVTGDYYIAIRAFAGGGGTGQTYTINFNSFLPGPGDPTSLFASGFQGPVGMAVDAAGDLFVPEFFGDQVSRVTPGGVVSVFATGILQPQGVAFDGFGELLVTSADGNVYKVSATGVPTAFLTGLGFPVGITTGPDGSIWVFDASDETLRHYDAFGVFQSSVDVSSAGGAAYFAFSPTGELYFCNGFDTVYRLVGGQPQVFIQAPEFIEAIAFDIDGFLYVANGFLGKVILYAPDGSIVDDPFAGSNLGGPINLAFGRDTDGTTNARLFAANLGFNISPPFSNGIVEMNPAGMRAPGWRVGVDLDLLVIGPNTLPDAVLGADYSAMLTVTNQTVAATWSIVSGALPAGISLDPATGALGNFPTAAGTFAFRVRATSGTGIGEKDFSITVTEPTLAVGDVANGLLGAQGVLTPEDERFLDLAGNGNGVYDVADFRAYLEATGLLGGP